MSLSSPTTMDKPTATHDSKRSLLAAALVLTSLLLYLPGIDSAFFTTGEPREALVPQSMLIHSDLLRSERYENEPATKPPLFHWFAAGLSLPAGNVTEASARMPSVIAAITALVFWAIFVLNIFGRSQALLIFLVLSTSPEWFRSAAHARVDMLLAALCSLALLSLYTWEMRKSDRYLALGSLLMAGAALTKGPIGVVLPCAAAAIALITQKTLSIKKILKLAAAAAIALLPLATWYAAISWSGDGAILKIALEENLARLLGEMSKGSDPHEHGPLYLIAAFFLGMLPWSLLAIPATAFCVRRRSELKLPRGGTSFISWCAASVTVGLAIFLIPASKRSVYLLPVYPPAAVLISVALSELARRKPRALQITAYVALSLVGAIWASVLTLRLGWIDLAALALNEKALTNAQFYLSVFDLSSSELWSFRIWIIQLLPLLAVLAGIYGAYRRRIEPLQAIGVVLALVFVLVKVDLLEPAAEELSPKRFVQMELRDHRPPEIALRTSRMFAEAFYARQLNPDIAVKHYDKGAKYVLLWSKDRTLLPKPLYIHKSPDHIEKPGRQLEFAIID